MNISSVIVIPHPDHVEAVPQRLREIEGVEVHATSPEGKVIVTVEAENDRETTRIFELISLLDGVMSASMVYHQSESDPEMEISVEA
jgi:nitrate reductase NapD